MVGFKELTKPLPAVCIELGVTKLMYGVCVVVLIKESNRMTEHKKIWIVAMYATGWQDDPSFSELAFAREENAQAYLEHYLEHDEERFGAVLGPFYLESSDINR
jgi:hypothetical protein